MATREIVSPAVSSCSPTVQINGVSYVKEGATAEQPGSPMAAPCRLEQAGTCGKDCKHHSDQHCRSQCPLRSYQPNGYRECPLKDHRTGDVANRQPILLPVQPQKTIRHLGQFRCERRH